MTELLWITKTAQSTSLSHSKGQEQLDIFSQAQRTSRYRKSVKTRKVVVRLQTSRSKTDGQPERERPGLQSTSGTPVALLIADAKLTVPVQIVTAVVMSDSPSKGGHPHCLTRSLRHMVDGAALNDAVFNISKKCHFTKSLPYNVMPTSGREWCHARLRCILASATLWLLLQQHTNFCADQTRAHSTSSLWSSATKPCSCFFHPIRPVCPY